MKDIPKSAATLIPSESSSHYDVQTMLNSRGSLGYYIYLGIEKALSNIIDPTVYTEPLINILINIDGMDPFNKSKEVTWSILGKVYNEKYKSSPFIIALFSGKSKPASGEEYLKDLVLEVNELNKKGITIKETTYQVKIIGFVCDTTARAFIKGCKGHTGFYACERCTIKGITVNHKRVYPSADCELRTNNSFRDKKQKEHHEAKCHLLEIPYFDPITMVFHDSMHLLWIRAAKWLIEQ